MSWYLRGRLFVGLFTLLVAFVLSSLKAVFVVMVLLSKKIMDIAEFQASFALKEPSREWKTALQALWWDARGY